MEYSIQEIPLNKIYNDTDFNCRGRITPLDVKGLAENIKDKGLQFPIAVQPRFDVPGLPEEYDFRIIAGHRRYMAFKILKISSIPAMVRSGLSEIDARLMNLSENLIREDLNIKQEAEAVKSLRLLNLTQEDIAEKLSKSRTWVQIRLHLLRLPKEIQEEAAAGFLNQTQIRQLHGLKDKDRQFEAVRKIKTSIQMGQKGISVEKKPQENPDKAKKRSTKEVQDLMNIFAGQKSFGLHLRCLAWTNGNLTTRNLFKIIQEEIPGIVLPELGEQKSSERNIRKVDIGRWS